MRDKAIVFLLLVLVLAPMVSAEDMLGGMGQSILDTVMNVLNYEMKFPASKVYGYDVGKTVPLWTFILVFMIVFSILWLASAQVPLFKDSENSGPRKAFAIAFAALVTLGTPAVTMIQSLISTFTSLAFIAILVLGVYTIWVIFRGGWAANRKTSAAASQSLADAAQNVAEAKRARAQTDAYKSKTVQAEKHGLGKQVNTIKKIRRDMGDIATQFQRLRSGSAATVLRNPRSDKIIKSLEAIQRDMGELLTFSTENDRILTGMSKSMYRGPAGSLTGITRDTSTGATFVDIKKRADTETNDLGRIISGLMETIRTNGINSGVGGNIDHLLDMTNNAINILNRMERDIVLESQMVDKI